MVIHGHDGAWPSKITATTARPPIVLFVRRRVALHDTLATLPGLCSIDIPIFGRD